MADARHGQWAKPKRARLRGSCDKRCDSAKSEAYPMRELHSTTESALGKYAMTTVIRYTAKESI
jgi:hypothetical protein